LKIGPLKTIAAYDELEELIAAPPPWRRLLLGCALEKAISPA
jgi:hypothetical protein